MIQSCPSRDEWLRRFDGEVTANRASELDAHAGSCGACSREAAQLEDLVGALRAPTTVVGPATIARVMAHLDDPPVPARRWHRPVVAGGFGALACAAVVMLVMWNGRAHDPGDELQPRGQHVSPDLARQIGIEVYALGAELHPLADGARVTRTTAYVASYRNVRETPAFALVFAVDAAREVHWLYPAYTDAASDPEAIRLAPNRTPTLFAETVVLDQPAPGALALVEVVSARPLHVSDVERLAPEARTPAALRARFPGAVVRVVTLAVGP